MIPAKQFFQEMADELNRRVQAIPTTEGRLAFLRAVESWLRADPFGSGPSPRKRPVKRARR